MIAPMLRRWRPQPAEGSQSAHPLVVDRRTWAMFCTHYGAWMDRPESAAGERHERRMRVGLHRVSAALHGCRRPGPVITVHLRESTAAAIVAAADIALPTAGEAVLSYRAAAHALADDLVRLHSRPATAFPTVAGR